MDCKWNLTLVDSQNLSSCWHIQDEYSQVLWQNHRKGTDFTQFIIHTSFKRISSSSYNSIVRVAFGAHCSRVADFSPLLVLRGELRGQFLKHLQMRRSISRNSLPSSRSLHVLTLRCRFSNVMWYEYENERQMLAIPSTLARHIVLEPKPNLGPNQSPHKKMSADNECSWSQKCEW